MDGLINEYFSSESPLSAVLKLAETLRSRGILDLVRALQGQLTGEDELVRTQSTKLLADVLGHIKVPSSQLDALYMFFCSRLPDGASFEPAIEGLIQIKHVGDYSVLTQAMEASRFRQQPQNSRNLAYKYLASLGPSMETFGLFIDMASGEKDPLNLLTTLGFAAKVADLPLDAQQREDLFDITFCYFPITFKPPKNMHYEIDVEQIKQELRNVLRKPALAEHVVPGLISKLTALNPQIKADVLNTLGIVLESYPDEVLHAYWLPVFDSLKFEILHGSAENEVNSLVFKVLQRLAAVPECVDAACIEIAGVDPTKKALALQVCLFVNGMASSQAIYTRLCTPLIEVLLANAQVAHLELLNVVLLSAYLPPQGDQLLSIYLSGLGSSDYAAVASKGLPLLASKFPEFCPVVVQALTQHLPRSVEALAAIARTDSKPVGEAMATLYAEIGTSNTREALNVLGQLAVTKSLVQELTIRLVAALEREDTYLFEILFTLWTAINHLSLEDLAFYHKYILPALRFFFTPQPKPAFMSEIVIDRMALIMELTVRAIPASMQASYADEICRMIWPEFNCVFGQSPSALSFLMTSCLAGIDESALPPRFQISFVRYLDILKKSRQVFVRAGYLRYLTIGVNKWPNRFGDIELAVKLLKTSIETNQDAISDLEVLCWLGKGLLMRNDKLGYEIADYVCNLCVHNRAYGNPAARAFGVLVMDDRVLCKENRIVVRQLYKQKLMVQLLPQLLQGFNSAAKPNAMLALAAIIRYTSVPVLVEHLDKVMPVLLDCLSPQSAPGLQLQSLSTISATMAQPDAFKVYDQVLAELVRLCLDLAATDGPAQAAAIEVIYLVAVNMPKSEAQRYKPQVLRILPVALGSIRREVRRQASRCIQVYHVLAV